MGELGGGEGGLLADTDISKLIICILFVLPDYFYKILVADSCLTHTVSADVAEVGSVYACNRLYNGILPQIGYFG